MNQDIEQNKWNITTRKAKLGREINDEKNKILHKFFDRKI